MKLRIIVDKELDYEKEEEIIIIDEISENNKEVFMCVKSLKDILPDIKEEIKEKISNQIKSQNDNHIKKIMTDLLKTYNSEKNPLEIIIDLSSLSYEEYKLIDRYLNNLTLDVKNISDGVLINILNNHKFSNKTKFIDKYNRYSKLSQNELIECYESIYVLVKKIKRYNLTPLEQLLFIFDLVREKPYKIDEKMNKNECRDISKILDNDYIVCEGYANLVSSICTSLEIKNEILTWKKEGTNRGHATNLIYLNDEYYDIHGIFEMDITSSTKKDQYDKKYLNDYKYFLLPFGTMLEHRKKQGYSYLQTIDRRNSMNLILENKERLDKAIKMFCPDSINIAISKTLIEKILNVINYIKEKNLEKMCIDEIKNLKKGIIDNQKIDDIYTSFIKCSQIYISSETFVQSVYKVRRIEHLMDPKKYPLTLEDFKKIIDTTMPKKKEQKLLELILGITPFDEVTQIDFMKSISAETSYEKIEKDIKRIEMLNILYKELENKKTNEKVKKLNTK